MVFLEQDVVAIRTQFYSLFMTACQIASTSPDDARYEELGISKEGTQKVVLTQIDALLEIHSELVSEDDISQSLLRNLRNRVVRKFE